MIENNLTDDHLKQLLCCGMEGDQVAYQAFLTSTHVIVNKYLHKLLGGNFGQENIDDLGQEVMLSIHQKKHTYLLDRPLLPWIFAITRYRFIDFYRTQKRKPKEVPLLDDIFYTQTDLEIDLDEVMALLNPQQQNLLRLVKVEGVPYSDAAKSLGISVSSIKVSIHRIMKWLALTLLISIFALNILPWNELRLESGLYFWENFLWFGLSLTSGMTFYYSAFPEKTPVLPQLLSVTLFVILLALVSSHSNETPITEELNLWRGRCGFLITIIAMAQSVSMVMWAKKGAPRSPLMSGAWASLSASALGCLLMQVICLYDNSLHLIIWHFVPLILITFFGAFIARKTLHW